MKTPLHSAVAPGRLARVLASLLVGRAGLCATLLLALSTVPVIAAEGDVDPGFIPNLIHFPRHNRVGSTIVASISVQVDGKIVVGGKLSTAGSATTNFIARLNAGGAMDLDFTPTGDGSFTYVSTTAIQADGKILIGGNFDLAVGASLWRSRIARIDAGGDVDFEFNPNPNSFSCESITVQPDEKILIGGTFTSMANTPRNRIARINADGTLDPGFNPDANQTVDSTAVQADRKIVIGGYFTVVGAVARNRIARLNADGTLDSSFNPNADGPVRSMAVQADGKIVICGEFITVGNSPRYRIARLNADGTLDTGFIPSVDSYVYRLALQSDGKILIGGNFTSVGGIARNSIARLNADGTLDTGFNSSVDSYVYSLVLQSDGKILIGGSFTSVNGIARNDLARLLSGPATQILTVPSLARVQWLRGGTTPEVIQVTFELSTNATTWMMLGSGSRISGGWELNGLSLPPSGTIRARGYANGSSGLVEQQAAFPPSPEIAVQQPAGTDLTDGVRSIGFGIVNIGSSSPATTLSITNSGNANLILTNITKDGPHSGDFTVGALGITTLAPGTSTTFSVTFSPAGIGPRSAAIHIFSNDSDESPFDIALTGVGEPPSTLIPVLEAWTNGIGDTTSLNAVAVDGSGNVVVTGSSYNTVPDYDSDYYTAKYAADGVLLWEKRYNGPANTDDRAEAVAVDASGNVVVAGVSYRGTNSDGVAINGDYYTAKYASANGALLWERRYNGPANFDDQPSALVLDGSGNVIVTGVSYTGATPNDDPIRGDYYTAKYAAANGALLWERRYNGQTNNADEARAVAVDSSGNVIVTGISDAQDVNAALVGGTLYTAKYAAANGALLWEKRYNGPAGEFASGGSVAVDASGNVVVAGKTFTGNDPEDQAELNPVAYTAKYAAAGGALIWERRGPNRSNRGVAVDGSGNVIVTGNHFPQSNGRDYYTAKYAAANGAVLWENRYNGPGNDDDDVVAVGVDASGNVVVTGESAGIVNLRDYHTAKYAAANGVLLWEKRYHNNPDPDASANLGSHSLALGPNGMVAVTGDYGTVVYWESLPPVAIALVPGGVRLRFTAIPDRSYIIERAPALDGPWTILDTVIARIDGIVEFVDTNPLPGSAFYRASTP